MEKTNHAKINVRRTQIKMAEKAKKATAVKTVTPKVAKPKVAKIRKWTGKLIATLTVKKKPHTQNYVGYNEDGFLTVYELDTSKYVRAKVTPVAKTTQ
jgi:hypothetical protein